MIDIQSIGLPPKGRFHMDVDPTQLVLLNQSIHGSFVGGKTDIEAALEFARKGMSCSSSYASQACVSAVSLNLFKVSSNYSQ